MKRFLFALAMLLLPASALAANSTISGTVTNVDATVCANCTISFNSQIAQTISGTTYQPLVVSTVTDSSGVMTAITLPQGLMVQVQVSENGQTFTPWSAIVPFMSSATFNQLNQGISTNPLNVLASSQPPTGPLSMNSQKITTLACPTTANDALAWGCNATVNNLTVTGTFTQNTSGSNLHGLLTDNQISTPSAPTSVTAIGTSGATTYYYFLVCHDGNGGTTLPSTGTQITNSNATLSGTNYNQVAFSLPTNAQNCDILRNTTNTTTGAQSITGGLAVTASPVNDQSNSTSAYVIPTRNTTGDGQFAGALSAGTVATGIQTGDLSTARAAGTGKVWYGSNGSQSIDFGIANASVFTLTGGGLTIPSGNVTLSSGNLSVSGTSTLTGGVTGNLSVAGTLSSGTNGGTGGQLTMNGATSGHAAIAVAAAAGTPTTLVLPTTNATAGQFLQNDGSGNLSWANTSHGQQLFTSNGTFTVPAGVYSIQIECWGAGGGGGGYDTGFGNGTAGGDTTVGSTNCLAHGGNGGTGVAASAVGASGAGGAPGTGTITGQGNPGFYGSVTWQAATTCPGACGGGGAGGMAPHSIGIGHSYAGYGADGGGDAAGHGGGGGGSGGYSEVVVSTTPSSTFSVTLGAGGNGGAGVIKGRAGYDGMALVTW